MTGDAKRIDDRRVKDLDYFLHAWSELDEIRAVECMRTHKQMVLVCGETFNWGVHIYNAIYERKQITWEPLFRG